MEEIEVKKVAEQKQGSVQQTPVSNSRQNLRNSLNKGIPGGKKKLPV